MILHGFPKIIEWDGTSQFTNVFGAIKTSLPIFTFPTIVGENINEVERKFSEYLGLKGTVALSSGTAALHLAIKLAGLKAYGKAEVGHGLLEGKKVFCSDMTFSPTVDIQLVW